MLWWGGGRNNDNDQDSGGAGAFLAIFGIALLIFAPIIAQLMQLASEPPPGVAGRHVRGRADPLPARLISALEKLKDDQTVVHSHSRATAHLWIEQPMPTSEDKASSLASTLFDTHPPLEERIAALREL